MGDGIISIGAVIIEEGGIKKTDPCMNSPILIIEGRQAVTWQPR
jgi:hypothetical protein